MKTRIFAFSSAYFIYSLAFAAPQLEQSAPVELQQQLKSTELSLAQLSEKISRTQEKLALEKKRMHDLLIEENELNTKLAAQKHTLNQQLVFTYRMTPTPLLQTLLSKQNINQQDKMNVYIKYFHQAQEEAIHDVSETLLALASIKKTVANQTTMLEKLYAAQKTEQAKLQKLAQQQRAKINHFY